MGRILDYSDGSGLEGEVAEKYYCDSILKLKLDFIDGEVGELSKKLGAVSDIDERNKLAQRITELIKQKEKLKHGVQ